MPTRSRRRAPIATVLRQMKRPGATVHVLDPGDPTQDFQLHPPLRGTGVHALLEVGICFAGEVMVAGCRQPRILKGGDAVVIRPGAWHYESWSQRSRNYGVCWFVVTPVQARCNVSSYRKRQFEAHWLPGIAGGTAYASLYQELVGQVALRKPHWRRRVRRGLSRLVTEFRDNTQGLMRSTGHVEIEPLEKVLRIMEVRFREPLTIHALAKQVGLTPNYLSHRFNAAFHTGFKNYLNVLRVWHGQRLLEQGHPVKATAAECGFQSVQYFTTVFKQLCGMPPARFARDSTGAPRRQTSL
jgi:AraC-like DNA-binding protein